MTQTLEQLASITNSSYSGDKDTQINSVAALDEAVSGQISFVSNPKYIDKLADTSASAVILSKKLAANYPGNVLINDNPYLTFAQVLEILHGIPKSKPIIHNSAIVANNVKVHETVSIGPNVVIDEGVVIEKGVTICAGSYIGKNSHLAEGVHLYPNVTLYDETHIGRNSIIHSGAVIGSDGFGFAPTPEKTWFKILQVGNVAIGKDVEIGANTTVDRAALGTTRICDGVKLDNQIHIGHNVKIDEHTVIAAGTLIAGSSSIGKHCQIGGAAAISGHLTIADDVIITGRAMVIKSIKSSGVYSSGIAADENKKWRKNAARFRSLDEIAKKVNDIDRKLNEK
ncbi:MAG: UDP-3-O-[3-hydroxymyristoyl] glucosamine N-acyltransferase [Cocleimonas sp.]|jgi:UDP-3-O-[3-hydroxymyristoyl] glucosamine N-acyltransferase